MILRKRGIAFLHEEVSLVNADVLLCFIAFGTGIIDAFTFVVLDVFAANQTGNTIFLALSAAQVHYDFLDARRSITAMTAFWVGSFISGQIGHKVGATKRWWLFTTFFIQGLLAIVSAILLWSNAITDEDIITRQHNVLGLITVLSFGYGAQATTARGLKVPEIPTVVITSAMVDLFGDKNLFKRENRPRNRRIAFIICLFMGAFIGGWIHNRVNGALTNCIAGTVKIISAFCIFFFESKESAALAETRGTKP